MGRIFVYPLLLSSLLTVSYTASAVLTEDIATDDLIDRLTRSPSEVALPSLPIDPVEGLISAVNLHSAALGFSVDHGPSIRASAISNEFAGVVALLVQAVIDCRLATTIHPRRDCAAKVNDAAAAVIQLNTPPFGDINAWPTLYIDGNGTRDFYVHDYTALIDTGGDDVYDNNAGGNLQDIKNGPPGSSAPSIAKGDRVRAGARKFSRSDSVGK